jgi:hypothetical protein
MGKTKSALMDIAEKIEFETGHDFDYIFDCIMHSAELLPGEWQMISLEDTLSDAPRVDECSVIFKLTGETFIGSDTQCRLEAGGTVKEKVRAMIAHNINENFEESDFDGAFIDAWSEWNEDEPHLEDWKFITVEFSTRENDKVIGWYSREFAYDSRERVISGNVESLKRQIRFLERR